MEIKKIHRPQKGLVYFLSKFKMLTAACRKEQNIFAVSRINISASFVGSIEIGKREVENICFNIGQINVIFDYILIDSTIIKGSLN